MTATGLQKHSLLSYKLSYNILFLLSIISFSADSAQDLNGLGLNEKMSRLGNAMANLFPLAVNDAAFTNPSNQDKIKQNLAIMADTISQVKPHFENRSATYLVSYEVIKRHINDIQAAYHNQRLPHAQAMLRATAVICVSCHSQDQVPRKLFKGYARGSFSSDFDYAEYNFITRNYAPAVQYYRLYLDKLATNKTEAYQLTAVRNILMVYTQVLNDIKTGITILKSLQRNTKLTTYTKKNIEAWLVGLKEIQRLDSPGKTPSYEQLQHYVDTFVKPGDGPFKAEYHYWIKGLLYRYLSATPPNEQIPSLLYWLSVTDRITSHSYYYSLGDLYLKHCMLDYPHSPYAKKCYAEYEDYVVYSYSGSRGTDIPDDIQIELESYRKLVNNAEPQSEQSLP